MIGEDKINLYEQLVGSIEGLGHSIRSVDQEKTIDSVIDVVRGQDDENILSKKS